MSLYAAGSHAHGACCRSNIEPFQRAQHESLALSRRQPANQVLNVGIVHSIAKLISYRVLQPAVAVNSGMRLSCKEGELDELLADLAVHRLDLVLSDQRMPVNTGVKAYNHKLGESAIAFRQQAGYRLRVPHELDRICVDLEFLVIEL